MGDEVNGPDVNNDGLHTFSGTVCFEKSRACIPIVILITVHLNILTPSLDLLIKVGYCPTDRNKDQRKILVTFTLLSFVVLFSHTTRIKRLKLNILNVIITFSILVPYMTGSRLFIYIIAMYLLRSTFEQHLTNKIPLLLLIDSDEIIK